MTVLGPLPDHVARALRGESQEPQAAPREECAAASSARLPPDVRVGANPPYTSVGGREMRGLLAGLADREALVRVIREHAGMVAFDLEGLDSIAKGIEKQWVLGIDPATSPSHTIVTAVDTSAARAVKVPVTISTVDTCDEQRTRTYAYAQRRIETNYATLDGGLVLTHPADEDRWTVNAARDVIDEELRKVGAELFILYRHAGGHEVVVEGGTDADVAEALRRAITRSHVALTLIGTTLVGSTDTTAVSFSRPGKSLGCRDPSASLSFGGGSGLLTPEMKDALEQRGRTIAQGPNHQQLPPRASLPCGLAFHGATGRHPAASTEEGNTTNPCREIVIREPVEQVQIESTEGWRERVEQSGREPKPTRVTVAGGSMLDALGFTEQVTRSRCPDCNGSGVLVGFGFGMSENAIDRPCPCSPPKDEGPSEWTVVDQRLVDTNHFGEWWNVTVCKGPRKRMYEVIAGSAGTTVSSVGIRKRLGDFDVVIKDEHCVDMAIARLLCGLRDGSIVP